MCRFCPVLLNSAHKYILRNCELFHEIYYILVKKYTTHLINLVNYKEEFEDTKGAIIIRSDSFNLTKRNPWFSNLILSSNPLSKTS